MAAMAAQERRTDEVLAGGQIKGGILSAHLRWAEDKLGIAWKNRLQPHLTATGMVALQRVVLTSAWFPFRTLIEIDRAIAAETGQHPDTIYQELGRFSADWHLAGVYRAFARGRPHEFFSREAMHHRQYLDFGRAIYQEIDTTSCSLELVDTTCFSPVFCLSSTGYYRRATELHGGTSVNVTESHCRCCGDDRCTFSISWTEG